jgi:hypothetical protein
MIQVAFSNAEVSEIVENGLIRSFTRGQVTSNQAHDCLIHAGDSPADRYGKQIVFGKKPPLAPTHTYVTIGRIDESNIIFDNHVLTQNLGLKVRAFERYDFGKEWNNLGYGKISPISDPIWGLCDPGLTEYCGIFQSEHQSILWFNRPVGPIDGFDWRIIEDFISCYRPEDRITLPVLSEIPAGFSAASTFRIDCDESIASGRELYELYRKYGFPFSLAIKTEQDFSADATALIQEVISSGGSILIHSHTHAPEWGEPSSRAGPKSRGDAFFEASTALSELRSRFPDAVNSYAVSPFHQNPRAALPKLLKAGIDGFVGGIICNDPEFLLARGGQVPFCEGMISHSEQCMFHGDCIHPHGDSLEIYDLALENAVRTHTFFGYLDHPFSNYHYGWRSESARLDAHERFLKKINSIPGMVKLSTRDSLDFFHDRSIARIRIENGIPCIHWEGNRRSRLGMKVRWKGGELNT